MVYVPLGDYLPDQPDYGNPGTGSVRNVVPRTAHSYGPMPALVSWSGPLAARCQGAVGLIDGAGTVTGFAGDASRLYRMGFTGVHSSIAVANGTRATTRPVADSVTSP